MIIIIEKCFENIGKYLKKIFPGKGFGPGFSLSGEALPLDRPHAREGPADFLLLIFYVVFASEASKSMCFYVFSVLGLQKACIFT